MAKRRKEPRRACNYGCDAAQQSGSGSDQRMKQPFVPHHAEEHDQKREKQRPDQRHPHSGDLAGDNKDERWNRRQYRIDK